MNLVYFPFTAISGEMAAAAYSRFGRFTLYSPVRGQEPTALRKLSDEDRVELRSPVIGEEELVMNLCRSFRSWGSVHQGRAGGLKRFAESGFYNNQFASEIRSEILKGGGDPSHFEQDPIRNARVFLQMAQEFDLEQAEIEIQLAAADQASKRLFDELKGEFDGAVGEERFPESEDTGAFMGEARMTAWALLASRDELPLHAFLTHSRAILDLLSDRFPAIIHLGNGIEPNGCLERIDALAKAPWKGTDAVKADLDLADSDAGPGFRTEVYVVPDCSPENLVGSFVQVSPGFEPPTAGIRHSFVFLLNSSDKKY